MAELNPLACAAFMLLAFVMAGMVHSAWLRSSWSQRFAIPLDGGRTFRGRRLFGDNKTLRGFMVMVPATGLAFAALALVLSPPQPPWRVWPLSTAGYAALGAAAGFGFMAGELPNSFIKRQLDILPGEAPQGRAQRFVSLLADRLDSLLGVLLVVSLMVPLPWQTWALLLLVAPFIHSLFSALLYVLGVKKRAG